MKSKLKLSLFGGFRINTDDSQTITIVRSKVRALICYLAMNSFSLHSRQKLSDLLWPNSDLDAGRNSLRQTVSLIKNSLPNHPVLVTTKDAIGLNEDVWEIDIHTFLSVSSNDAIPQIEDAFHLYQNDLMEGFQVESPAFEDWLMMERRRLQEKMVYLGMKLLTDYQKRGALDSAMEVGRKILSVDPCNETCYRGLLQMLIASGQKSRARILFEELKQALDKELQISPDPQTLDVVSSIIDSSELGDGEQLDAINIAAAGLVKAARALAKVDAHNDSASAFECAAYLYGNGGFSACQDSSYIHTLLDSHREYFLAGDNDKAKGLAIQALEQASSNQDIVAISQSELCLANCERLSGELKMAEERAERSLLNARHIEDLELTVRANLSLATTRFMLGDYQAAFHLLNENRTILAKQSLGFSEYWDPGSPLVRTFCWYAWCCSELGRFQLGLAAIDRAIAIAEQEGDTFSRLNCRITQGILYLHQMQYQKAIDHLDETLDQLERSEIAVLRPMVQISMALCHVFLGNNDAANSIVNGSSQWPPYPILMAALGIIYTNLGQIEMAERYAQQGQQVAKRINAQGDEGWCWLSLAALAYSRNRTDEGDKALANARHIAKDKNMMPLLAKCEIFSGK